MSALTRTELDSSQDEGRRTDSIRYRSRSPIERSQDERGGRETVESVLDAANNARAVEDGQFSDQTDGFAQEQQRLTQELTRLSQEEQGLLRQLEHHNQREVAARARRDMLLSHQRKQESLQKLRGGDAYSNATSSAFSTSTQESRQESIASLRAQVLQARLRLEVLDEQGNAMRRQISQMRRRGRELFERRKRLRTQQQGADGGGREIVGTRIQEVRRDATEVLNALAHEQSQRRRGQFPNRRDDPVFRLIERQIAVCNAAAELAEQRKRADEDKEEAIDSTLIRTDKFGPCTICMEDMVTVPSKCISCDMLVGCRKCIARWFRRSSSSPDGHHPPAPACPLCRHPWIGEAAVIPIEEPLSEGHQPSTSLSS